MAPISLHFSTLGLMYERLLATTSPVLGILQPMIHSLVNCIQFTICLENFIVKVRDGSEPHLFFLEAQNILLLLSRVVTV